MHRLDDSDSDPGYEYSDDEDTLEETLRMGENQQKIEILFENAKDHIVDQPEKAYELFGDILNKYSMNECDFLIKSLKEIIILSMKNNDAGSYCNLINHYHQFIDYIFSNSQQDVITTIDRNLYLTSTISLLWNCITNHIPASIKFELFCIATSNKIKQCKPMIHTWFKIMIKFGEFCLDSFHLEQEESCGRFMEKVAQIIADLHIICKEQEDCHIQNENGLFELEKASKRIHIYALEMKFSLRVPSDQDLYRQVRNNYSKISSTMANCELSSQAQIESFIFLAENFGFIFSKEKNWCQAYGEFKLCFGACRNLQDKRYKCQQWAKFMVLVSILSVSDNPLEEIDLGNHEEPLMAQLHRLHAAFLQDNEVFSRTLCSIMTTTDFDQEDSMIKYLFEHLVLLNQAFLRLAANSSSLGWGGKDKVNKTARQLLLGLHDEYICLFEQVLFGDAQFVLELLSKTLHEFKNIPFHIYCKNIEGFVIDRMKINQNIILLISNDLCCNSLFILDLIKHQALLTLFVEKDLIHSPRRRYLQKKKLQLDTLVESRSINHQNVKTLFRHPMIKHQAFLLHVANRENSSNEAFLQEIESIQKTVLDHIIKDNLVFDFPLLLKAVMIWPLIKQCNTIKSNTKTFKLIHKANLDKPLTVGSCLGGGSLGDKDHLLRSLEASPFNPQVFVRTSKIELNLILESLDKTPDQVDEILQVKNLSPKLVKEYVKNKNNERILERRYLLNIFKCHPWALKEASDELKNDLEFVSTVLRNDGSLLYTVSEELRNHRSVVLTAVKQYGRSLQFAAENLKNDQEIVLMAIQQCSDAFEYASDELKNMAELILDSSNVQSLQWASTALKDNEQFMLDAIHKYGGGALKFASVRLRSHRRVVLAAVSDFGAMLKYASNELKNNRDVVSTAMSNYGGEVLYYVSDDLKNDREVVSKAVGDFGEVLVWASEEMKSDREIVTLAVKEYGMAVEFVSDLLQQDLSIQLLAISQCGNAARSLLFTDNPSRDRSFQQYVRIESAKYTLPLSTYLNTIMFATSTEYTQPPLNPCHINVLGKLSKYQLSTVYQIIAEYAGVQVGIRWKMISQCELTDIIVPQSFYFISLHDVISFCETRCKCDKPCEPVMWSELRSMIQKDANEWRQWHQNQMSEMSASQNSNSESEILANGLKLIDRVCHQAWEC